MLTRSSRTFEVINSEKPECDKEFSFAGGKKKKKVLTFYLEGPSGDLAG